MLAGSMGFACAASLGGERVGCREYRVLPVTDRDLWVTRWVNAACVVPAALLLVKGVLVGLAAADGRTLFAPGTLLLSTLFDAVYAAAFLPVPLWLDAKGPALAKRFGTSAFLVSLTLLLFSMPAAMAAPFFFARSLPEHLDEFSTTGALTLGLGLALAMGALLWTPRNGGVSMTVREGAAAIPHVPAKPDTGRSLKGIPVVLWSHAKPTFVAAVLAMSLAAAGAPFLPPRPAPERMVTGMFLAFAFLTISMTSVWGPWTRQLRVLPLSVRRVNALFVLTPLVTWLVVWIAALLVHALLGWPLHVELAPAAILTYAGLSALSHAVGTPLNGSTGWHSLATMLVVVLAVGGAVLLLVKPDFTFLVMAAGILSFVLAATINHFTLTRSTSSARTYRFLGAVGRPW